MNTNTIRIGDGPALIELLDALMAGKPGFERTEPARFMVDGKLIRLHVSSFTHLNEEHLAPADIWVRLTGVASQGHALLPVTLEYSIRKKTGTLTYL